MAVIVDAKKVFENTRIVVYSYFNYDHPDDAGVILIDLSNIDAWQVFPPHAFPRTAELALLKAYRENQSTGGWPEIVSHIS